jgi:DNA-binding MarR family transcriptional regulator
MYGVEVSVSNIILSNYSGSVAERDPVDDLIEQWAEQRPDLADQLDAMAAFGRLGRLFAHASRAIEDVFRQFGLRTGEFDVLAALRRNGPPHTLTPTNLARRLMLSPAGVTDRLDRLEAAGLVVRRPDPDDRRGSLVVLTPKGLELVDDAVTAHVANETTLLSALSEREQRSFDHLLRKLLASIAPPAT